MNGLGLLGLVITLAVVGLLVRSQQKAASSRQTNALSILNQDDLTHQTITNQADQSAIRPEVIEEQIKQHLHGRMKNLEDSTSNDN